MNRRNGFRRAGYDLRSEELASEKYGHTKLLRQVKGVGPITLAYLLTLENPLVKSGLNN